MLNLIFWIIASIAAIVTVKVRMQCYTKKSELFILFAPISILALLVLFIPLVETVHLNSYVEIMIIAYIAVHLIETVRESIKFIQFVFELD